jgi:hypothetical protein
MVSSSYLDKCIYIVVDISCVNGFLRPKSKENTEMRDTMSCTFRAKHISNSMLSKSCHHNVSNIITRSQEISNNISIVSLKFFRYIYNLIINMEGQI